MSSRCKSTPHRYLPAVLTSYRQLIKEKEGYLHAPDDLRGLEYDEIYYNVRGSFARSADAAGEVSERLKEHAWKVCIR